MKPEFSTEDAIDRASVVIDCTPSGYGHKNKNQYYEKYIDNTLGFVAQGSEFGFGKMYARGVNDSSLIVGEDKFVHVVSCNTHNLSVITDELALKDGKDNLINGRFNLIRRANDVSQPGNFIPAPQVGSHKDPTYGTHHARDAFHLFETLNLNSLNLLFPNSISIFLIFSIALSLKAINGLFCLEPGEASSGAEAEPSLLLV